MVFGCFSSQNQQNYQIFGLDPDSPDLGSRNLPLRSLKFNIHAVEEVVRLEIQQEYENVAGQALETQFKFPVEEHLTLTSLRAMINEKEVVAKIEDKERAQEKYEDAISAGKTAIMGSFSSPEAKFVEVTLGNLLPQSRAKITFEALLRSRQTKDGYKIFLPESLVSRFVCGPGKHVVMSGGFQGWIDGRDQSLHPQAFEVNLQIDSTSAISEYSMEGVSFSSVKMSTMNHLEASANPSFSQIAFSFTWKNQGSDQSRVAIQRNPETGVYSGMLNFFADLDRLEEDFSKGEFILLLDRSGSMSGGLMEMAKQATILFIKSLPPGTHFNVISFGSSHRSLFLASQEYNAGTVQRAVGEISGYSADMGGTDILNPLQFVYNKEFMPGVPRYVFLVTDGGVGNTKEVLDLISLHSETTRVFSFGIGSGASVRLVEQAAERGRGASELIQSSAGTAEKVVKSLNTALQPSLSNFEIEWRDDEDNLIESMATSSQKDKFIFNQEGVGIHSIFTSSDAAKRAKKVTLKYDLLNSEDAGPSEMTAEVGPDQFFEGCHIEQMAAREHIRVLEKKIQKNKGDINAQKKEVVKLSKQFHVLSTETALIASVRDKKGASAQEMTSADVGQVSSTQPLFGVGGPVHIQPGFGGAPILHPSSGRTTWSMPPGCVPSRGAAVGATTPSLFSGMNMAVPMSGQATFGSSSGNAAGSMNANYGSANPFGGNNDPLGLFGGATSSSSSSSSSGLFGASAAAATTGNNGGQLFGSSSASMGGGAGLFGSANPSAGLFGSAAPNHGNPRNASHNSMTPSSNGFGFFGSSNQQARTTLNPVQEQSAGLFGSSSNGAQAMGFSGGQAATGGIFGSSQGANNQSTSLFGSASASNNAPSGGGLFGSSNQGGAQPTSLFGAAGNQDASANPFGGAMVASGAGAGLFGSSNPMTTTTSSQSGTDFLDMSSDVQSSTAASSSSDAFDFFGGSSTQVASTNSDTDDLFAGMTPSGSGVFGSAGVTAPQSLVTTNSMTNSAPSGGLFGASSRQAAAFGSSNSTSVSATGSNGTSYFDLVQLQKFNGEWDMPSLDRFSQGLNLPLRVRELDATSLLNDLGESNETKMELVATMLGLVLLKQFFSQEESQWTLCAKKARKYLRKFLSNDQIEQIQQILTTAVSSQTKDKSF